MRDGDYGDDSRFKYRCSDVNGVQMYRSWMRLIHIWLPSATRVIMYTK